MVIIYFLQDTHADGRGVLQLDKSQDCSDFKYSEKNDVMKYTFRRKFDTCDRNDYIIEVSQTILEIISFL